MATSSYTFSSTPGAEVSFRQRAASLTPDELVQECAAGGDANAWEEFIHRFRPLIAGVVSRAAMRWTRVSPDLVEDLVQETYLRLCIEEHRHLRHFSSRHERGIYSFLKTVATHATTDYFRSRFAAKRGGAFFQEDDLDAALQNGQEPGLENQILVHEIEKLSDQITCNEQEKVIFKLRFQEGYTTRAIAEADGVQLTQKGVESCLHRITSNLREMCSKKPENHR